MIAHLGCGIVGGATSAGAGMLASEAGPGAVIAAGGLFGGVTAGCDQAVEAIANDHNSPTPPKPKPSKLPCMRARPNSKVCYKP
ncbi:hypothetical protein [Baekduia sp.]|uniref:hypothetical protein n=1 Tax=Baekduia sp. TaxID=2600305 RepID=UPI002D78DD8A|nr:hypothetical protein [Baekduia sp.]